MRRVRSYGPLLRAAGVLSAVGVLVTSVTYAALQSQPATLTGNTIRSATADLRIGTTASSFSPSRAGFSFDDVIPGGPAMPADGNTFYLKDYGTAALGLKVSVGSTPTNADGVDLSKVFVVLTRVDTGAQQQLSLQELIDSQAAGGKPLTDPLSAGASAQYKIRAMMTADAFKGTGATIGAIDLVFSGAPVL